MTAAPDPIVATGPRLSPSRAADFKQCPLLFRFRAVDRLDEEPSDAALRGTVVHAALQRVFDLAPADRTAFAASALLGAELDRLVEEDPRLATLIAEPGREEWIERAAALVRTWFTLEDPAALDPLGRELKVECLLEGGLTLRGIVDRLDPLPGGQLKVVDYKTGRAPSELFEAKAMFQMKFYALVLLRSGGVAPQEVQLTYLSSGEVIRMALDPDQLMRFERQLLALWAAIERAARTGDWRANPGRLCEWCDHRQRCPAWGNVAPAVPEGALERLLGGAAA